MSDITNVNNTVILLDQYTRTVVSDITFDALSKHATVITDVRELGKDFYGSDFIFFDASVPSIMTREILEQNIEEYDIKAFLIYQEDTIGSLFNSIATTVKANYSTLDWNLIYAVLHADMAILEPYQRSQMEPVQYASLLGSMPSDMVEPVNRMYISYLFLASSLSKLIDENSKLSEILDNYKRVGDKTTESIQELVSLLDEVTKENRSYATLLSKNYDNVFTGLYLDRPRTLYIKTINHTPGVDVLIATLFSVFTIQYKVSCKVVRLVDASCATTMRYTPNNYFHLEAGYHTSDLLTHDFVVKMGSYTTLFDLLMLNRSKLDILIVHDMRGTLSDALDSSLVDLKVNEMSPDYANLSEFENILSDSNQVAFPWPYKTISKYTGTNSIKLTNHETIAKIVDYLL